MGLISEYVDQIADLNKSLASAEAVIESISGLFPDNACHKHPGTGVSLLDDVSDVITKYHDLDGEFYNLHIQLKAATARAEAAERERDEAQTHAQDLRGALEGLLEAIPEETECEQCGEMTAVCAKDTVWANCRAVLARTPAQSLNRLKEGALREEYRKLAKRFSEADHRGRPATLSVTWAVLAESMDLEADRLEKEAAQ